MIRRVVVAVFVMLGLMAAPMVASAAPADYPAPPAIGVISGSGGCDAVEPITVTGEGYDPSEEVEVVVKAAHTVTKKTTADADGTFSLTLCPSDVGKADITVKGMTSGVVQQTTIMVKAASGEAETVTTTEAGGAMPNTGVNRAGLILGSAGGVLALIIGAGLLWLGATRRKPGSQSAH